MLNPNLASKISYERILNNFQNEAVNQSGVLLSRVPFLHLSHQFIVSSEAYNNDAAMVETRKNDEILPSENEESDSNAQCNDALLLLFFVLAITNSVD